jgi:hypothetical protein
MNEKTFLSTTEGVIAEDRSKSVGKLFLNRR